MGALGHGAHTNMTPESVHVCITLQNVFIMLCVCVYCVCTVLLRVCIVVCVLGAVRMDVSTLVGDDVVHGGDLAVDFVDPLHWIQSSDQHAVDWVHLLLSPIPLL